MTAHTVFFMLALFSLFFQPFVIAFGVALLTSMLIALTVTPALSMILLSGTKRDGRQSPVIRLLQGAYNGILSGVLKAPRLTYIGAAVLVVLSLIALPFLNRALILRLLDSLLVGALFA